ncbi:MAG: glycosyltransferase [Gemmatimonadales bacterium]
MRILFLSNLYPTPWHPGRGVFNLHLVEGLRGAGHEVRVVVPIDWRDRRRPAEGTADDARVVGWFHPPGILHAHWDRFMWRSLRGALRDEAARFAPDVICANWLHPDGAVAVRLGREIDRPVAVIAGGSDLLILPKRAARGAAIGTVLREADAVLTHGQHLRQAAIDLGAAPERTIAFYRGVDRTRFTPGDRAAARAHLGLAPDATVLLSVGNLVPVKGVDVLVDALASAPARQGSWQWVHIGEGAQRDELERRIRVAGIADRTTFVGRQPNAALPEWYRAADLLVLPSRSEGVPNVLMEAMACGLPFVASAVGGVPEIAPDPSWCVPPDDAAALSVAVAAALAGRPIAPAHVPDRETGLQTVIGALELARAVAA